MGDKITASDQAKRLKYIYDYVADLDRELNPSTYKTVTKYKMSEVYQPEQVIPVLKRATQDPKTSKQWRINPSHVEAFTENPSGLLSYLDKFKTNGELVIEHYNVPPSDERYLKYFADTPTERTTVVRTPLAGDVGLLRRLIGEPTEQTVIEYELLDKKGLVREMSQAERSNRILYRLELPQDVKLIKKAIEENKPDLLSDLPNPERYTQKLAETYKLAPYADKDVWTSFDTYLLLGDLGGLVALTGVSGKKQGSLFTNIPDPDINAQSLPTTYGYQITLEEIAIDPEAIHLLATERRNKTEQGLPILIQQSFVDAQVADKRPQTEQGIATVHHNNLGFAEWVTVNDIQQLLKQAGAYALKPALRYLHDHPNGGDISLTELMYYDENIKAKYPPSKGIPKSTREQYSNSLRLQLMFRYEIPEKTRNRETKLHYISLIKGMPVVDDNTGLITRVEGLNYGADLKIYRLLGVIDHKQADFLTSPEAKFLESKIQTLIVYGQQLKKTVKGEPLIITVDKLLLGVVKSDKNPSVYYNWLAKQLNEFTDRELITKWHTEQGGQDIKREVSTKKLYIYPSKLAQEKYRTPEMKTEQDTKAKEAERQQAELQKLRLTELKKAKRQYNNDTDLAQELKLSREQLDSLLSKAVPISLELADKVQNLLV